MMQANAAPWIAAQTRQLLAQRGHAWLLTGPSGLGQYSLALALVGAWLCEQPSEQGACGTCASCHAIAVRTHADLFVLMPEVTMLALGWPLDEKTQSELEEKKRKPSKEIRVDAVRDAVAFSQRTQARGRGKVVLAFPAERMNTIAATALLKTLEEPAGDVKFVLATAAQQQLLPTLRSRCQTHAMLWPNSADALAWLADQGVAAAAVFLRAAGGRPDDALALAQSDLDPSVWAQLPQAVARGEPEFFKDWPISQVAHTLHKICHDVLALHVGAAPLFFAAADLPQGASIAPLTAWAQALSATLRQVEHPFHPGLMLDALLSQAQLALAPTQP